jgi:GH35 family endo-1,4-beta-xylanase
MNFATVSEFVDNATDAGMSVYGHTLAWHSQQPVKWLNSLLADKPAPIPEGGANACIVYDCGDAGANPWDKQAHYKLPIPMEKGKTYVVKARVKADNGGDFGLWPIWDASPNRDQWGGSADVSYQASYPITSSFSDLEWTFEAPFPIDKLQFVFGKIGGKVYIDDLSCKEKGSDAEMVKNGSFDEDSMDGWGNNWNGPSFSIEGQAAGPATFFVSLINNGDMEGDDATNFAKKENAGATVYEITDGVGKNGSRGVKIASKGGQPDAWESQFWIVSNEVLHIGDKIHVAFDYRADGGCAGTNVDTQAHFGPGEYQHWACAGTVSFSNEWQTYDKIFTVDASMAKQDDKGMKSIAFNMSPNAADGTYYIDNVVLEIEKSGDGIPLTPEERKDTLTWAMEKWIAGMMEACDGKVKAWDVVNEAISGGNPDGEGVYALQHGTPDNTTDFFWQDADKLGDLDYVRTAVRLARQYGPEDIKLFINDYNLESDWDQNNKLKSLIAWIKRWEADGVTKIDGIGSQMHISCYANPTTQASKKAAIENMLKLMASSGKLCRISELDMGYVDADGNSVKTIDMTEEMHHQMAELYTFVIEKYKEIIPVNQQWGICQWCATDAPADSGWRKGEPVGLWDSNYYRKHTYAGFADGLGGK